MAKKFDIMDLFNNNKTNTTKKPRKAATPKVTKADKFSKEADKATPSEKLFEIFDSSEQLKDYYDERLQRAKEKNVQFIGGLTYINVKTNSISRTDFVESIRENENLPEDWFPETLDYKSLYLNTLAQMSNWSGSKFSDTNGQIKGYLIKKIKHNTKDEVSFVHQVFVKQSDKVKIDESDATEDGLAIEHFISVILKCSGDPKDLNNYSIESFFDEDKWTEADMQVYKPFLHSLEKEWKQRCQDVMKTDEIRSTLVKIITNELCGKSINNGLYYILPKNFPFVQALNESLQKASYGQISLCIIPLEKDPYDQVNVEYVKSIGDSLLDEVIKDLSKLESELESYQDSDTNTRPGTLGRRRNQLQQIANTMSDYHMLAMLDAQLIESKFKKVEQLLNEQVAELEDAPTDSATNMYDMFMSIFE